MKIDLCALTADVLPLYAEGLLSPETQQLVEDHAATCPSCREQLRTATMPISAPALPEMPTDKPVKHFFGRMRRLLFYGLVGAVILMVGVGGLGYQMGRRSPWEKQLIPARVTGAEDLAARAIPGWGRAEAQGLLVDLGITEKIPGTEAAITLEKAWYSGRQAYILYTVRAPKGQYVLPSRVVIGQEGNKTLWIEGRTNWSQLNQWGGFSEEGFHSVLMFERFAVPDNVDRLNLTFRQWAPVTPESGLVQGSNPGGEVSLTLPWQAAYLKEPAPEVLSWNRQHTWMGRTLALQRVEVGVGRIRLVGQIELPQGERKPGLGARLHVGGQILDMKEFKTEPAAETGRYRFTATFDGPNQWPAPVKLELLGISFETDRTLEWSVPWAKYRHLDGSERKLMDTEDQVSVRFYDSELVSIFTTSAGVSIEQKDPKGAPPYVRASLAGGGRGMDETTPGMEVVNDQGEVLTNIGGGSGVIYDDPRGRDQRQGLSANWWNSLPESFMQSDRLTIRYVYPSATLVLNETWDMGPSH